MCVCVCVCACLCMYMHTCMHIYIYIYIYIYTHTHTHAHKYINYSDDLFSVLYKARYKKHQAILEVIAIMLFHLTCTDREDNFILFIYLRSLVGLWRVECFFSPLPSKVFFLILLHLLMILTYLNQFQS